MTLDRMSFHRPALGSAGFVVAAGILAAALAACVDDAGGGTGGGSPSGTGGGDGDGDGGAATSGRSSASTSSAADGGSSASGDGGNAESGSTGVSSPTSSSGSGGSVETFDVHVEARAVEVDGGALRFGWSNGAIRTRIDGSDLGVQISSPANVWYTVEVDGVADHDFQAAGGLQTIALVSGLEPGVHDVALVRRNEGTFGTTDFVALVPGDGTTVVPTPAKTRRLELIGDSLTAGYGILGADPCDFSATTQSSYVTYGAIAARALDAEAHIVAQSGKGVIQNYGGNLDAVMPELWTRAFTNSADPPWDTSSWQPDAVVVNLGTNDFSAAFDEDAFVNGYATFLGEIRAAYPNAHIVAVTWAIWGAGREALVQEAVAATGDAAVTTTRFTWPGGEGAGCDGHTNVVTNARLGAELEATLRELLGW